MNSAPPEIAREDVLNRLKELFTEAGFQKLSEWDLSDQAVREIISEMVTENILFGPDKLQAWEQEIFRNAKNRLRDAPQERLIAIVAEEMPRRIKSEKLLEFKRRHWGGDIPSLFLKRRPDLERVTFSLIRIMDQGLAREVYCRLLEGEQTFAGAAAEFSSADAANGAVQGPVPLSSPHPDLSRVLQSAQPGEIQPPLKIAQWWVITRLENRLPAQMDEPTTQWLLDRAYDDWIRGLFQNNQPPSGRR